MQTMTNGSTIAPASVLPQDLQQCMSILNAIPALVAYLDQDMRYRYINAAYEKWSEHDAQAIVGKSISDVLGAEVFDSVKTKIATVRNGNSVNFEASLYNKGELWDVDISLVPHIAQGHEICGYTLHIHDITHKKKVEKELRQRNAELQDYFDNGTIAMHWVDANGTIVWANQAELKMMGYEEAEYVGRHISEFHADQEVIADILERLSRNESLNQYEAKLRCKDGTLRHVIINSNVLWIDGEFVHTRCFTLDVSDRKQAQQKLQASEQYYRQLIDELPLTVYTCDSNGYLQQYNKAAEELFGRKPETGKEQWCGSWKIFNMSGQPVAKDHCPMAVAIKEGRRVSAEEVVVERPDGTKRIVKPHPKAIFNDDGNVIGGLNVVVDITDQKQAEQALKQSERSYHTLLEGLPVAVYTCDAQGYIHLYNKAAVELWGREPEVGKDLWCGSWKIFNPEDGSPLPLDTCPMAIALTEGRRVVGREIIVERQDGTRRFVAPHPQPMFDTQGHLIGAMNMLEDITERKYASQELEESEERFRSMANQAPIVIWMFDQDGECTYLNTKWNELTGCMAAEGYGRGWMKFMHPDDRQTAYEEWSNAFKARTSYNVKFRYASSEHEYIIARATGNPRYNAAGEFVGYIGILLDITSQERAKSTLEKKVKERTEDLIRRNEELRRSEERYHRMVAEVQDYAIILLSREGVVENWNKGAENIKGYSAEEIVGKNFRIFYSAEDQERRLPQKLIKEAEQYGKAVHEGWRVRKDGTRFWGSTVITALHDDHDYVIGFSKVTRDLTVMKMASDSLRNTAKELEEKNRELERINKELASFAYVSSHDLQEPLRKIQAFASRIMELEANSLSEKGKDYFSRMQNAAQRMQNLIEDLLAYSRTSTAERKFELLDINVLIEEVKEDLKEVIHEKKAVIQCSLLPTLPVIPFQFQQLMINILSNALKFAKQDVTPHIVIQAGVVKGDKIHNAFGNASKDYYHIAIADNGIGFEPQYNTKIFEVFQRLHGRSEYSGTGIGLAICKKIVENHGGVITAEGEVGKGATFHIYIPVQTQQR